MPNQPTNHELLLQECIAQILGCSVNIKLIKFEVNNNVIACLGGRYGNSMAKLSTLRHIRYLVQSVF